MLNGKYIRVTSFCQSSGIVQSWRSSILDSRKRKQNVIGMDQSLHSVWPIYASMNATTVISRRTCATYNKYLPVNPCHDLHHSRHITGYDQKGNYSCAQTCVRGGCGTRPLNAVMGLISWLSRDTRRPGNVDGQFRRVFGPPSKGYPARGTPQFRHRFVII